MVYIFEKFSLKSSLSIKNPILNMNDYDFSIQDFVIANLDFQMLKALENEPQIHWILEKKSH